MKQPPPPNEYRDTWAGTLGSDDVDREVRVAGWVHRRRDHGGLIFIDLRDRSGIVQLVVHPGGPAFEVAEALRPEHVVSARGKVVAREPGTVNPNLPTGEIEIALEAIKHLAVAETPPFPLDEDTDVDEVLRLRYRYLDLRREQMKRALLLREQVVATMRRELETRDFLDIETPVLTKSTPEGARDYLVPNRRDPGTWYALPQSPQLFKQLLMIAGYERYYQIARCFRDEDTRADRQPEFTQLDVEMAFVTEDEVIGTIEAVMSKVFALGDKPAPSPPYERLPFDEAMSRYGTDRPDRRFGLELHDVSAQVHDSQFKVFQSVLDSGGAVLAINAGRRELSRSELDGLNDIVRQHGGKAVAWAFVEEDGWRSPIAKFLTPEQIAHTTHALDGSEGDLLIFAADRRDIARTALGGLRLELGRRWGLIDEGVHDVFWVVDFPMFEWDEDERSWTPLHHPFTAPEGDLAGDPGALRSRAYDLICDGSELGGGSIRIHRHDVQMKVLELLGMSQEEATSRFGFLLDALRFGAPPHGGIAFGVDRVVTILGGQESIRDVIAFPKTATGQDPLTAAPSPVDERQLRELGLRYA